MDTDRCARFEINDHEGPQRKPEPPSPNSNEHQPEAYATAWAEGFVLIGVGRVAVPCSSVALCVHRWTQMPYGVRTTRLARFSS